MATYAVPYALPITTFTFGTVADAKDNYYINAHSKCTSTVIDMGFITNVSDLKKVTTDKDKTAQAIADGITDYLKQAGLY